MLVPMQPPPTTTASADRGTPDGGTLSCIEWDLIALSFAVFLFPSRHTYRSANDNPLSPRIPDARVCRTRGGWASGTSGPGSRSWAGEGPAPMYSVASGRDPTPLA